LTFLLKGDTKLGGVPTSGIQCVAFLESRFGAVPVLNTPFPDTAPPDAGPVSSGESFGGVGAYQLTVASAADYYVACFQATSPNIIAWEGPLMATPHTSKTGWTAATNLSSRVGIPALTTIASGSNGVSLPTGTLNTAAIGAGLAFAASGTLILCGGVTGPYAVVNYTGLTSISFTGCTGGSGTMHTGDFVIQGFVNGPNRRLAMLNVVFAATSSGVAQSSQLYYHTTIAGSLSNLGVIGIGLWSAASDALTEDQSLTLPVDPGGTYGVVWNANAGDEPYVSSWVEVDF